MDSYDLFGKHVFALNTHMETPDCTGAAALLVVINTSSLVVQRAVVVEPIRRLVFAQTGYSCPVVWRCARTASNWQSILVLHG